MDGVFEDSSWPQIIRILDGADHIFHHGTRVFLASAFILLYYTLMGGWLDLLLGAVAIGFGHRHALLTFAIYLGKFLCTGLIPIAGAVAMGLWSVSHLLKPVIDLKGPAQPYLIPCKTTHTRLFPKNHSFGYSYLVVGVPVGSTGNVNGMLMIDDQSYSSWDLMYKLFRGGWYTVNDADYMQRGHNAHGLRGKLDEYLKSQGVEPSAYPHAYLVTAARFLGYHFNPVSFWYLYSEDKILSAIVLEVNNTFDERRPYLVLRDVSPDSQYLTGPRSEDTPLSRVKGSWAKDFHVSPFNSRKGAYSLIASDPLGPGMEGFRGIDVTINLNSSKGHTKLVTRLFSQGEAIDPAAMGPVAKMRFLLTWCWVGFATFPRIVKEAAVLFFKRELHVWYRPEPLKESLGRHATKTERQLEAAFRRYLKFLVEQCQKPMSVRYVSSGILSNSEETFTSPPWHGSVEDRRLLELKVLTPIFYHRFVHYAHDFEAIFTEFMDSATIWVSEPQLLPDLLLKKGSPPLQSASLMDYLFFKPIQYLRRRPEKIPSVLTSAETKADEESTVDIRDLRMSSMDAYILEHAQPTLKAIYRSTLLRLFVADHFALGNVAFLDVCILLWRIGIAWACAATLKQTANAVR
ncbi:hypothetical protein H634G_00085 [Metarhizium anisopliae BRIP 53293]|uniref:DNA-binding WRKY domain-containing protein n=1 Tax=Metarhizium anisopliae BRIP 53293 TaxID=1291518 RepID=A0A0D9PEA3_METAN|nr:hypothetical protein H634G_00085 [Metarhizium anisopliae BRIP 53293]KJK88729.1 hypothetical protein H633G_07407 [Metarhizium anisopliae BRIP 53284]